MFTSLNLLTLKYEAMCFSSGNNSESLSCNKQQTVYQVHDMFVEKPYPCVNVLDIWILRTKGDMCRGQRNVKSPHEHAHTNLCMVWWMQISRFKCQHHHMSSRGQHCIKLVKTLVIKRNTDVLVQSQQWNQGGKQHGRNTSIIFKIQLKFTTELQSVVETVKHLFKWNHQRSTEGKRLFDEVL